MPRLPAWEEDLTQTKRRRFRKGERRRMFMAGLLAGSIATSCLWLALLVALKWGG